MENSNSVTVFERRHQMINMIPEVLNTTEKSEWNVKVTLGYSNSQNYERAVKALKRESIK